DGSGGGESLTRMCGYMLVSTLLGGPHARCEEYSAPPCPPPLGQIRSAARPRTVEKLVGRVAKHLLCVGHAHSRAHCVHSAHATDARKWPVAQRHGRGACEPNEPRIAVPAGITQTFDVRVEGECVEITGRQQRRP